MLKKIIIAFFISCFAIPSVSFADDSLNYTTLTRVDLNTFNEYRYRMTEKFFDLKSKFEINWSIDKVVASSILEIATKWYNYLPDNLINKNLLNNLKTAIERGLRYPDNDSNYTEIKTEIVNYIEKVNIQKITWSIEAFPSKWNAPLSVTFRASVKDPSWTKIPNYNYVWWMDVWWKRKILTQSKGPTLNHTFTEEWNFSVFLDVSSDHKNVKWYNDVLPFRSRENIEINEKIASLIIKVNSSTLRNKDELKFTPEEARYWLIFDATSSTPTWWSKFILTEWDFWNGVERKYSWDPQVERVIYSKEWEYRVELKLRTNEWKTVEREFDIVIHDPIATIKTNLDEWFLWDKFTFSSESWINEDDLTYDWEIIDILNDEVIFRKSGKLFTYSFLEKWQYNVKLKVTEPSSNVPDIDTKVIYINSRAPVVDFTAKIPYSNKPNTVLLDATKTYDPDFSDEWKLVYSWIIDWERVELENPNFNWSIWYYTFDYVWSPSVVLEVTDPDDITIQHNEKFEVKSILSLDFWIFPRVATREQIIRFVADSPEARVYEWDFWDWEKIWWSDWNVQHKYTKSWVFKVKLKVIDKDDNYNTFMKDVYIGDSNYPYAFIKIVNSNNSEILFKEWECSWKWAYILDRVNSVKFSWEESINIDGETKNLTYSWKLDNNKYYNSKIFDKKFDELWCFPIKLTVKSDDNWRTSSREIWVKVENLEPVLSSVDFGFIDESSDPVIVKVDALGAKDIDWVIQNYLWYYYTDIDSEPQDFRATRNPNTTFVLPKVTWNYYFVVVMKDNNEARISSEDITWSKYFITLTWDNLNTPLIKLNVDNSSVSIWEDVAFTAKVENILWHDISKNVEYSWDFDGDWFYEKESNTAIVSHVFENSWEFHVKVKAKHKWFSNTKSITVSVANILKPDFSYISIWNKFVFLDNSIGNYSNIEWNLWDGTIIKDKETFVHEYTDNNSTHLVTLKLTEWTKTKTYTSKVLKNVRNLLKAKKQWLIYFSNIEIVNDELVLEEAQKVYIYLKESKWNIAYYWIDFDLNYDSDLNWWKDDDIDNENKNSYTTWDPILVELNNLKEQKIRLILFDENTEVIDSYDFTINKLYITELDIDITSLNFNWVSNSEKLKIEKLKNYISNIDSEYKLKALMYVQKLQEEWFDNREKTNVILEFENYIAEIDIADSDDIINLLESLLVEWQEDKSEKSIMYNALKNLLPIWIQCELEWEETTCYNSLIEKLDLINTNSNIDENRVIWTEILKVVEVDTIMTNKQKLDFKAILKTFVYGWIENIPEEEISNEEVTETNGKDSSDLLWLLWKIVLWLIWIIWTFWIFILLFYIWFRLTRENPNIWFQDFIIEKTGGAKSAKKEISVTDEELDILSDIKEIDKKEEDTSPQPSSLKVEGEDQLDKKEEIKEVVKKDIFNFDDIDVKEDIEKKEEKISVKEEVNKEEIVEIPQKVEEKNIPDWLKWSFNAEEIEKEKVEEIKEIKEVKEEKVEEEKIPTNEELEEITKIDEIPTKVEEKNIPDWLKWSFDVEEKTSPQSSPQGEEVEEKNEVKKEKVEEKKEIKQQFSKQKQTPKKTTSKKKTATDSQAKDKKTSPQPSPLKGEGEDQLKKEKPKPETKQGIKTDKIKSEEIKEVKKSDSELWEDWMKIPDWLKTDWDK